MLSGEALFAFEHITTEKTTFVGGLVAEERSAFEFDDLQAAVRSDVAEDPS